MEKWFNVNGENAELLLHGIIGIEISGLEVANKLQSLKDTGVKKVTERLNSGGGSIVDGYSIVSANLNLTENGIIVETINEGVSDSMMSIILSSGTKGHRKARDFTTSVIHNPLFGGTTLNDIKDEGIKAKLTSFKDSLLAIYAAALGKSKEELSETMNEEKMLNAEEMLSIGLIDSIIKTDINLPNIKDLSLAEIMNVYEGLDKSNTNIKKEKMDRLNDFYNLQKDASEDSLLKAAKAERKRLEDVTAEVEGLKADLKTKTDELDAKVTELEKFEDESIKVAVNAAIETGKFDEKEKDQLIENAKKMGLENFNFMVSKMKVPHVDVHSLIQNAAGDNKKPNEHQKVVDGKVVNKTFEDYTSDGLHDLRIKDEKAYEALVTEFNERD